MGGLASDEECVSPSMKSKGAAKEPNPLYVHASLAVAQTMMAGGAVYLKRHITHEQFNPVIFSLCREVAAGLIINVVAFNVDGVLPKAEDLGRIYVMGILMYLNQLLYITGMDLAGVVIACSMQPLIPVFTLAFGVALGIEKGSVQKLLGIALAVAGAITMVGPGEEHIVGGFMHSRRLMGGVVMLANTLAMAFFYLVQKGLVQKYPPISVTGWAYLGAAFNMSITTAVFVPREQWTIAPTLYGPLLYWIVGPSCIGYTMVVRGNKHLPSSMVAIYGCLQPLLGTVGAVVFLGEGLVARDLGALGILVGILLCTATGAGGAQAGQNPAAAARSSLPGGESAGFLSQKEGDPGASLGGGRTSLSGGLSQRHDV